MCTVFARVGVTGRVMPWSARAVGVSGWGFDDVEDLVGDPVAASASPGAAGLAYPTA